MYNSKWVIIGKGKSGWHAETRSEKTGDNSSSSSRSSSYDPTDYQLNAYASTAEDGALVYDASKADESAFTKFVVSGPIVNPDLPAGHISKDREPELYTGQRIGGFDYVSLDIYRSLLEKVPGVRFGKVINQQVVWD